MDYHHFDETKTNYSSILDTVEFLPVPHSESKDIPLAVPVTLYFGKRILQTIREVLETVVPAIVIALLINLFLAQATRVYGQSMEPNLHTNQRLVVEKISYNFHFPERTDIVVLKVREDSKELLIKRVIGLPGEEIKVVQGQVFINEQPLKETYLSHAERRNQFSNFRATIIPEGHVFVLGDNRGASNDSRSFGSIPIKQIIGRAWLSYWPVENMGLVR